MPQVSHLPNFDTVTHKLQATFGAIKSTANFSIYTLCLQITFAPFLDIWPAKISRERKTIKWAAKIAVQRVNVYNITGFKCEDHRF